MRSKTYQLMILVVAALLLTGCSTDNGKPIESGKEITMFVATDVHYLAKDLIVDGSAFQNYLASGDGKLINDTDEIMLALTNDIKKKKPEVLIISGDLTNNGERVSHTKLSERLDEIEQSTGTRIYVIPGNHDILNPWARGFHETKQYITNTVNAQDFETIYKDFGYGEAISKDKASLSYLAAPSEDLWLLMLDTCIYDRNELMGVPTTNGEIRLDTLEWIKQCSQLAKDNHARIVAVMHHNLLNHSPVLYSGFTLNNGEEVRKVLQESGISLVLSGHIHIQDIKSRDEDGKQIYDIATSSLSVYPVQYGVLKFNPTQGFNYSTSPVDVVGWAKKSGNRDENIINFKEYSKDYFADTSYRKAYDELTKVGGYSEHEKEQMAQTMSLLSINYFGGRLSSIKNDLLKSEGYQLWFNAKEPEFLRNYIVTTISDDNNMDNNNLQTEFTE